MRCCGQSTGGTGDLPVPRRHLQPVSERTSNNIGSRHKAGTRAVLAYRLGQCALYPSLNSALSQDLSHAARNKRMPEDAITVCPTLAPTLSAARCRAAMDFFMKTEMDYLDRGSYRDLHPRRCGVIPAAAPKSAFFSPKLPRLEFRSPPRGACLASQSCIPVPCPHPSLGHALPDTRSRFSFGLYKQRHSSFDAIDRHGVDQAPHAMGGLDTA